MTAEVEVDKAIAALQSFLRTDNDSLGGQLCSRLGDLTTACTNLSREADTAAQLSMKNEAMIMQLRNELAESRATELALRRECVELAAQSGTAVDTDKMRVRSGERSASAYQDKLRCENNILSAENCQLRSTIKVLQEQLVSCDHSLRYMEKEVAGRVQQLQLLLVELEAAKVESSITGVSTWQELNNELTLQRHKSMVDILRRNALAEKGGMPPCPHVPARQLETLADSLPRDVLLTKDRHNASLGFSVAGGKEFGTGLFVSRVEPDTPAWNCLFVGDHILAVNGCDVRNFSKAELVDFVCSCDDVLFDIVVVFQSNLCDHKKYNSPKVPPEAFVYQLSVDNPQRSQSTKVSSPDSPSWASTSGSPGEALNSPVPKSVQTASPVAAGTPLPFPFLSASLGVPDPTGDLFSSF